jgi:hypothetical protein
MGKSTAGGLFTLCDIFLATGSKSEGLKAINLELGGRR